MTAVDANALRALEIYFDPERDHVLRSGDYEPPTVD
jgi:hypothetical protein